MKLYQQCFQNSSAENFLYEACFKCYAHLSQWRELNKELKTGQLNKNLDEIWIDDWNSEHILPWLFLSEVHCSQETSVLSIAKDFDSALSRWITDSSHADYIKSRLGELLSIVLVVRGEVERSSVTCEQSMLQFLSRWQQLDPLSSHLRAYHLLQIHSLMDIHNFLSLPDASAANWDHSVENLLSQWKQTSPSASDSLIAWETRAVYRQIFSTKLQQKATKRSLKTKLKHFEVDTQIKTVQCALQQQNYYVAFKYLKKSESNAQGVAANNWELMLSKCLLLRAHLEIDPSTTKLLKALKAWDGIKKLKDRGVNDMLESSVQLALHLHTADMYSTLLSVVQEAPSVVDRLTDTERESLEVHLDVLDGDIASQLQSNIMSSLQDAVLVASPNALADCYLRLARFCHQTGDPQYEHGLIQSLLRAMKYESSEARRLFPCLLQLPLLSYSDLFMSESQQVPEWMFLGWVSQLLASLDSEFGCVLLPLMERLATAYPVALQFPFLLSDEMYKNPDTKRIIVRLRQLLALDPCTQTLVQALACVCQPHLCLLYHLDRLKITLSQGTDAFSKAIVQMKYEAYPSEEESSIKGKAFNDIKPFTDEVEDCLNKFMKKKLTKAQFETKHAELRVKVYNESNSKAVKDKQMKRWELNSFSPWLVEGYEGDVEIPGQYTGESRPLIQHHVTIAGFKRHVRPLHSLRAPIQLTILGNDARDYPFLVKFGEDLRQDQRYIYVNLQYN